MPAMAFVNPFPPAANNTKTHYSASHCSRRTTFFPIPPSRRSVSWNHALSSAPNNPLVIHSPTLLSMTLPPVPRILISGAPASGKGTQCEVIVQEYGVVHISTGDMLRAAVEAATPLGLEAKSYMDSGQLVPDHLVISMLKERIAKHDCLTRGWLLDGFPRTVIQAKALDEADISPTAVLLLEVEDDVLIERVIGRRLDPVTGKIYHIKLSPPIDLDVSARLVQRSDDTEEKARVRLEAYYKHSRAIQDHYGSILKKVDGNRSKSDVFEDLSDIIDASLQPPGDQDSDGDESSGNGTAVSELESTATEGIESVKSIPVAEFVRRAEEAYERGVLHEEDVNWSGQAGADDPDSGGTSSYSDLSRRMDLLLGDIFALLSFAYVGRAAHGDKSFDLAVIGTAAPFMVAWILASPLLGAYTRAATSNIPAALKYFSRSWAIAVPMGIGLRGVLTDHVPPAIFAVITLVFTFLFVGSWRVLYVKIRGDETDSARRGGIMDGFKMVTTLLRRW